MIKALVFTLGSFVWIVVGTVILFRIEEMQRRRIEKELGKVLKALTNLIDLQFEEAKRPEEVIADEAADNFKRNPEELVWGRKEKIYKCVSECVSLDNGSPRCMTDAPERMEAFVVESCGSIPEWEEVKE